MNATPAGDPSTRTSEGGEPSPTVRTSRDALYEEIGMHLVNAGVLSPVSDFIDAVRVAAGFRVSPRDISTVVTQIARTGQPLTVETVTTILLEGRGERSIRQQRHADEWRTLGAMLTLRGRDGSPEGQREFIGAARSAGGRAASDALLLHIAIAVAELGMELDSALVGRIARRIAPSASDLDFGDLPGVVQREVRSIRREESARRSTQRNTRRSVSNAPNPGTRRWRPGGRRRRKIKGLPKPER